MSFSILAVRATWQRGLYRLLCVGVVLLLWHPAIAMGEEISGEVLLTEPVLASGQAIGTNQGADFFAAEIDKARQELEQRMRAHVGLVGTVFGDDNDILVRQAGAYVHSPLFDALDVYAQVMTGRIEQDADGGRLETNLTRSSVELGVRQWFMTPRVVLWGGLLVEDFDLDDHDDPLRLDVDHDQLVGGKLGGKYIVRDGFELGLEGRRESMWQEHNRHDVRLFNRVTDISAMHPDMGINKLHGFVEAPTWPEHRLRVEAGWEDFEDDNTRSWVYGHYQLPVLDSADTRWTVLRPNIYYETVDEFREAYFSPESHLTMGLMLHTIRDFERVRLEAEVNPQLLWTRDQEKTGSTEAGVHGMLSVSVRLGDAWRVGVGGFGYADTAEYWLVRGTGFAQFEF